VINRQAVVTPRSAGAKPSTAEKRSSSTS